MPLARLLSLAALASSVSGGTPQDKPVKAPVRVWLESGPRESSVDVLFVGDGYTKKERLSCRFSGSADVIGARAAA